MLAGPPSTPRRQLIRSARPFVRCFAGDRAGEFRAINCEVVACSVDSKFSHYAWAEMPRREGGLGPMNIPLIADITKKISADYGVLLEEGIALRGLFIIGTYGSPLAG